MLYQIGWGNSNYIICVLSFTLATEARHGNCNTRGHWSRWWTDLLGWWHHLSLRSVGAAILRSMPACAALRARVQAERTRKCHKAAHRPAPDVASMLGRRTERRALWLHVDYASSTRKQMANNPHQPKRLHETVPDIDTTGGLEDMSKTKLLRSMLHVRTRMNLRMFKSTT